MNLRNEGPCLVCLRQTTYYPANTHPWESHLHRNGGDAWLDRQFSRKNRADLLESIEEGRFGHRNKKLSQIFRFFVCPTCKESLEKSWKEKSDEQKREREIAALHQDRTRWLSTWRMPQGDEFDRSKQRRIFQARDMHGNTKDLVFRARVFLKKECRGNSPAHRVALWVDGHLHAHYYGWELEENAIEDSSDLFGPGLAVWLERSFQRALLAVEPDAVWAARLARPIGRDEDNRWAGATCIAEPCLIHTVAPDGFTYASLRNFFTVTQVAEFAWLNLKVKIAERGAMTAAASGR